MSEEIKEKPDGSLEQGEFKIKKKAKNLGANKVDINKIDLSTNKEEIKEDIVELNNEVESEVEEESVVKASNVEINEVQELDNKEAEKPSTNVEEKIYELPSGLEKVAEFMQETGGTIQDYVRLNVDYSTIDDKTLLKEFYKSTKPHLDSEEVDFIMDDKFSFDEEVDEERDIRKKKLAFKEEIVKAKDFLQQTKDKYYEEIKLRPSVNSEQQKATEFFNRYNKEQDVRKQKLKTFEDDTKDYFSQDFKGFEFNLGEKKFRYNVKNVDSVVKEQSKLQGLVGKFLSGEEEVDYKNYHKAMYAARNVDEIAKHFYEQGKTDATKDIVNKSKNIETASRPQNNEALTINGFKVRAISGMDSSKLKIKTRKNKT
tara:strand:- start:1103 stop:2215 length:1113 start_codon:yes stop_codon:yes gene_type:complete